MHRDCGMWRWGLVEQRHDRRTAPDGTHRRRGHAADHGEHHTDEHELDAGHQLDPVRGDFLSHLDALLIQHRRVRADELDTLLRFVHERRQRTLDPSAGSAAERPPPVSDAPEF